MSKLESAIYLIFTWLPIVSIVIGVISVIIGAVLKHKGMNFKPSFVISSVFLGVFLLCLIALVIMGLVGIGPGRFD